jgi:hypothetical protein
MIAQGRNPAGWWIAFTYALTFGPALIYSCVYWTRERHTGMSLIRVAALAHLYVCYGLMWYAAGWWAVGRTLRRRTSWAKTERVAEAPVLQPAAAGAGAPAAAPGRVAAAGGQVPLAPGPVATVRPLATPAAAAPASGGPASPTPAAGPPASPTLAAGPPASPALVSPIPAVAPGSPRPAAPMPAPAAPASGEIARRGRGKRVAIAVMILASLAAGTVTLWAIRGSQSQHSQWLSAFNGYGSSVVTGSGTQQVITLSPARARTRHDTHAALVVSTATYHDFVATVNVRTIGQLRRGAAGRPHPWEVGWIVWHYTSNQHFYALTLEATGWVLSKQDPKYRGDERFLASGKYPRFPLRTTHRVGIVQIGNRITVSADGHLLTQFTDNQRPYFTGAFGVYSEDAVARFGNFRLRPLPVMPSRAPGRSHDQLSPSPTPARG